MATANKTIEIDGIENDVEIDYDYTNSAPDSWDCPGNDSEVEINSIQFDGVEIIDLIDDEIIEKLEQEILEDVESDPGYDDDTDRGEE